MARVTYNKLVRDGIQAKIEGKGEHCKVRVIENDDEFVTELLKKVAEEASELSRAQNREEFLAEYADLMVVLDALTHSYGFSEADITVAMRENVEKKGLYQNRHFLEWADDGQV